MLSKWIIISWFMMTWKVYFLDILLKLYFLFLLSVLYFTSTVSSRTFYIVSNNARTLPGSFLLENVALNEAEFSFLYRTFYEVYWSAVIMQYEHWYIRWVLENSIEYFHSKYYVPPSPFLSLLLSTRSSFSFLHAYVFIFH